MNGENFTPETVGVIIRNLRVANKMTQVELARHVEVSKNTVSAWENGLYFPSISHILALARVFCVCWDFFFDPMVCWDFFFDPMPCFDPEREEGLIYGRYTLDEWNSLSEDEQISIQDKCEYDLQHPDQKEWGVE